MNTLTIENVDLAKLDKSRFELIDYYLSKHEADDGVEFIISVLDRWHNEQAAKLAGSKANQEAKARQLSIPWFVCEICNMETCHPVCDHCDSDTTPIEFVK